jgi:hypothetical protein
MIPANALQYTSDGSIDLASEWRARRDEKAYTILRHINDYAELLYAHGEMTAEVLRAVQLDVVSAHVAIDVTRQQEGK